MREWAEPQAVTLSEEAAEAQLEEFRERQADHRNRIEDGRREADRAATLSTTASNLYTIARCLAVLGRDDETLETFEDAASAYLELVRASWDAREGSSYRRAIPSAINEGLGCALVAGEGDLAEGLAREGRRLSRAALGEFALTDDGTPYDRFKYYTAQLLGAIYLEEDVEGEDWGGVAESRSPDSVLEAHRTAAKTADESALLPMSEVLEALERYDGTTLAELIRHRLEQRERQYETETMPVYRAVAVTEAKYVHLATRRDLDVHVSSPLLPAVVLPEQARP